jgi:hypothetical protein
MLGYFFAYYSTLRMEALWSFEASVNFHQIARRYSPEDRILHDYFCGNIKSNNAEKLQSCLQKIYV